MSDLKIVPIEPPENEECECSEHDHYVCIDCGKELDPGVFIDRAMDSMEDR